MPYKEDKKGQLLQEGINEAGAMSSWIAASTAYSNHGISMIPVYIFYSMFGFQRIGDFAWAAGDSRARGFLVGGTAGRTTLNGEGLQHQDGHSQLFAQFIPNCRSHDPTFHYELATIFHYGLKRMYEEQNDEYFYLTTMNENYSHPDMPAGSEEGIIKGLYLLQEGQGKGPVVNLLGSGTILHESLAAAETLESEYGCKVNVFSATSFNELARDGQICERHNLLNPGAEAQTSWVSQCLAPHEGVTVASTDYMKLYAEQIRPYVPGPYATLGTDGFGRSGGRDELRRHFEVDAAHIVVTTLTALAEQKQVDAKKVAAAIKHYGIDAARPHPMTL